MGMEALLSAKGPWKCTQVLAQDFMTTLGALALKENFLDPTCKEIARGSPTPKDVWETLKDQLKGQESYTKLYYLPLLYMTKLEEGFLDVDGYVKSMGAVSGELKDVNLKLSQELVVLMTLTGLPPSFGTQRRILESRKDFLLRLPRKTCNKKLKYSELS
jgi:hypothetical protein